MKNLWPPKGTRPTDRRTDHTHMCNSWTPLGIITSSLCLAPMNGTWTSDTNFKDKNYFPFPKTCNFYEDNVGFETKPNDNGKYFRNFKMNHESVKCEKNLNILVAHFKWKILLGVSFGLVVDGRTLWSREEVLLLFWEHQKMKRSRFGVKLVAAWIQASNLLFFFVSFCRGKSLSFFVMSLLKILWF